MCYLFNLFKPEKAGRILGFIKSDGGVEWAFPQMRFYQNKVCLFYLFVACSIGALFTVLSSFAYIKIEFIGLLNKSLEKLQAERDKRAHFVR